MWTENSPIDYQIGTKFTYWNFFIDWNLSGILNPKYLIEIGVRENVGNVVALLLKNEYKNWILRNSIKCMRVLLRGNCIPILSKTHLKIQNQIEYLSTFSKPHFHTNKHFQLIKFSQSFLSVSFYRFLVCRRQNTIKIILLSFV